jgi:two-component system, OmpR family, response regulator
MKYTDKNLLLVDDDPDFLFQMQVRLQNLGFTVTSAESQREAEQILDKFHPDMAIIDLMMENEDSGFILSYKIKKKYPEVPVIILTAVAAETGITFDINDENNRKWIRADAFIDKSIRFEKLSDVVESLMFQK